MATTTTPTDARRTASALTTDDMTAELERMRARLLDLTARNPLLSYGHPRASSLRIVDEVPALVLERLVRNGGSGFGFAALPSEKDDVVLAAGRGRWGRAAPTIPLFALPKDDDTTHAAGTSATDLEETTEDEEGLLSESARVRREAAKAARARRAAQAAERASALGINPSFDLPAAADSGEDQRGTNRLQTLLSHDELETRLQKIQAVAVTSIQESGANMLHLLFGFVEWQDVVGGRARFAPLVLLPVTLMRLELDLETHTFPYTVAASGEDWDTNVTLQEKCRREFGFALPGIEADENLETYFARIEAVLTTVAPGWRVRRQLTLGLVSFGKILMWRDLDPSTWPARQSLLKNPLFREILGADPLGDAGATDEAPAAELRTSEYNIDRLPPGSGPVPPIVVPADSSQHSVLIDIQRGESLVVQGPPGTGKSQTITNMIAAAIASGKKVLFVAEKKVALEVVARRLVAAGLGPFCLPLHSHTSNKREFLDGLAERIALARTPEERGEIEQVEARLAETRGVLTGHAERIHEPFGALGDTAFAIFWRARRLASQMPEAVIVALRDVRIPNAAAVGQGELARVRGLLADFAAAHADMRADVRPGTTHPWDAVSRGDLTFDAGQSLVASARTARDALANAEEARSRIATSTEGVTWPAKTEAFYPLLIRVDTLVPPSTVIRGGLMEAIHRRAGEASVRAAVSAADAARQAWVAISGPWGTPGALTVEALGRHRNALMLASALLGETRTIADAVATATDATRGLAQLAATDRLGARVVQALGLSIPLTPAVAVRLIEIAKGADALPEGGLFVRTPGLTGSNAADRVATLAARAAAITRGLDEANGKFPPAMRRPADEMRDLAGALAEAPRLWPSVFSGRYRAAVKQFRRMTGGRRADRATMTRELEGLVSLLATRDAFLADAALGQLFGPAADGLATPFAAATALLVWVKQATAAVRVLGESGRAIADAVWSVAPAAWLEAGAFVGEDATGAESAAALQATLADVAGWAGSSALAWGNTAISELRDEIAGLSAIANGALSTAQEAAVDRANVTIAGLGRLLGLVEAAWAADRALAAHLETFRELGRSLPSSVTFAAGADDLADVRAALAYLGQFQEPGVPEALVTWLAGDDALGRLASLKKGATTLRTAIAAVVHAEAAFARAGGVDPLRWYGALPGQVALRDRIARFDRAIAAAGSIGRLVTWLRMRAAVDRSPMPQATLLLESGAATGAALPDTFSYFLMRSLAELVLRERPELDRFSGEVHEKRRDEFAELDREFIRLTQQAIFARAAQAPRIRGVGWGPVKDLTEQSLIEHEIDKTRRHIPIREMFRRAGCAIQILKPCVMMGPQAVAQYLPPGLFHFDLVVMDEASQMRPEDALGAIARGSQLVVVGDPKQLGPMSFFDAQASDEDDIDETAAQLAAEARATADGAASVDTPRGASVLERSESILLAAARRYPLRMLRWHYRSKDPQLIAFSNQEFYGNQLVLFPHPGSERQDDGVNFRAVDDAIYGGSINRREAQVIVDAVRAHAAAHPERTLLVVTMNQPQCEVVAKLLQTAEKDDPALATFRARHAGGREPEPLVKNLENVQGDERDVIFVSATYGPNSRGTINQNFGPVNTTGGERRLNVLFTRAKYRLDVFCSFDPLELRITPQSPRGLVVFRDYLRYAKEGTLAGGRFTGREPDSDFEIEVARAVRAQGYDVHPQIGVAGYFLDMAVVDPRSPGRYLLAIECDGATYHSAKSARERDRLRQGVLEDLGWTVHRIWSTDWFRDPRGETARVVRRIQELGGA